VTLPPPKKKEIGHKWNRAQIFNSNTNTSLPRRPAALAGLRDALSRTQLAGLPSNVAFLRRLAGHGAFETADDLTTAFIK